MKMMIRYIYMMNRTIRHAGTMKSQSVLWGLLFSLTLFLAFSATSFAQSLSNPTKLYTGTIFNLGSGDLAGEGMLYVYEDPYPTPVTSSRINATTGAYRVILDPAKLYWFRVEVLGYFTDDFMVATPSGGDYREMSEDLHIRPIPIDSVLYSGSPFADGAASFTDEAAVRNVLTFLRENPTVIVEIGVGLEVDKVDPVTKDRVDAIKKLFREIDVSTTRIKWERKLDDPYGLVTIKVDSFELP